MSTLLYSWHRRPVSDSEANVRDTVTTVQADAPSSVAPDAPDFNETDTDPITEGGLTPHQMASHVIPSERYVPNIGNANTDFSAPVDSRISTSGTAAQREMTGQWGHGTLKVVQGIEPTIRDGHAYGADYFVAHDRPKAHADGEITPSEPTDPMTSAVAQSAGTAGARQAVQESIYAAMHSARMGRI